MTDLRAAAQQALEACADVVNGWESLAPLAVRRAASESLDNLRAALAEHYCDTHCTWADHAAGCIRAEPVQEPVVWTDADADAARLAMELEALLLSCKDTAAVSRWWDSAHDALELHRQRLSMDGLANQQKTSGSPCPTCEALARAVMMDQTGKA